LITACASISFESKDGKIEGKKGMDIKGLLEWWQGKDKYDGSERRSFARLVYPPNKRPTLKIRDNELEIINISEEGLKFLNFMQRKFGEKVSGTVIFSNGNSIDVIGKIIWEHGNEFGMLVVRIKRNIIIEEIRALLREEGKNESAK
jgi:hypothetical protein